MTTRHPRMTGGLAPTIATAAMLAMVLLAPQTAASRLTAWQLRTWRRLRDDQGGSEMVQLALAAGLSALIIVAFYAVVRTFVMNEAENLPTSGGG